MENNNNITLSDVERNKELFEYEMTEVILQLKGEFAKLSGKDLNLKTAQLAAPKINIRNNIPEINVEQPKLDPNKVDAEISCRSFVIPDVEIKKTEINYQEIPAMSEINIAPIKISSPEINNVNVERIKTPTNPAVDVKMPDISAEIPQIKKLDTIPDVTVQHIAVEKVDSTVNINNMASDVQLESIKLSIPETDISLPDIREVSVQKMSIDVPNTDINVEYRPEEISVSPVYAISVPQISENTDIPTVNVSCKVDIPTANISVAANYIPVDISLEKSIVTETDIPKISTYSAASVTKKEHDINYVPITKMASLELPEVTRNSIKIDVPEMTSMASVKNTSINIDNIKINNDYPMIKTVEISPVTFKKTDNISIPEKPDFSVEIQSILESIV